MWHNSKETKQLIIIYLIYLKIVSALSWKPLPGRFRSLEYIQKCCKKEENVSRHVSNIFLDKLDIVFLAWNDIKSDQHQGVQK